MGRCTFEQNKLVNLGSIMCTFTRHCEAIRLEAFLWQSVDFKKGHDSEVVEAVLDLSMVMRLQQVNSNHNE